MGLRRTLQGGRRGRGIQQQIDETPLLFDGQSNDNVKPFNRCRKAAKFPQELAESCHERYFPFA
ncbi:hypothetical protein [Thiocystis minor]|uniref:hypothetical protein n=1 Tax=Thiocystis minor TaxID=61597 RepID=UPI0030B871C0